MKLLKKNDLKIIGFIILTFIVSRILMLLAFADNYGTFNILDCIKMSNIWDAKWYDDYVVAFDNGIWDAREDGLAIWAFFPAYPRVVHFFWRLLRRKFEIYLVGSVVSSVLFLISQFVAYKYIIVTRNKISLAYEYIAFMNLGFYSFYFSIMYTESMFLLFLTLCFYFLKTKNYLAMGICGMVLSATRNVGIMFVFVVLLDCIINYVHSNGKKDFLNFVTVHISNAKLILGTFMIPLGFFSHMFFLHKKIGDGMAFVTVQKPWGRETIGILQAILREVKGIFPPGYLLICFVFIVSVIIISLVKFKRFEELILPVIIILVSAPTGLVSIPRFMIASLTVPLALLDEFENVGKLEKIVLGFIVIAFELVLFVTWTKKCSMLV